MFNNVLCTFRDHGGIIKQTGENNLKLRSYFDQVLKKYFYTFVFLGGTNFCEMITLLEKLLKTRLNFVKLSKFFFHFHNPDYY